MSAFGRAIRDAFLLDPRVAYLNHGSFGATPRAVLAAQHQWQHALEREPVRFQEVTRAEALDRALERVGAFVGAQARDLVFVNNATTAVNAVVRSVPLAPGDEVLTTDHAYPAVRNTLATRCRQRAATLVTVPIPLADPERVVEGFRDAITVHTRLAVVDHISSGSALVLPVKRLVELCRARAVPLLVDGAHVPGQLPLDLGVLAPDWYTGNLHKWAFAPKGCGFLYAAPNRQADLQPPIISWEADDWRGAFHWQGTTDPSAWLASTAALDFLDALGAEAVRRYDRDLARDAARELAEAFGTDLPFSPDLHVAMVPIRPPGAWAGTQEEADRLHRVLRDDHAVEVPVFPWGGACWVRISAQVYNEPEDYRRLARALTRP